MNYTIKCHLAVADKLVVLIQCLPAYNLPVLHIKHTINIDQFLTNHFIRFWSFTYTKQYEKHNQSHEQTIQQRIFVLMVLPRSPLCDFYPLVVLYATNVKK